MSVFEFDGNDVQKLLTTAHASGELRAAVRAHLQRCVPHVYCGHMSADTAKEELKVKKYIFIPFEKFLCNGDPETVFEEMKNADSPSQLCGKVFKLGEPTYSCRDCGMDPTCVLCTDCFKGSAHRNHRYRMSTSGGGGYCDCGDVEAWKVEPFCDNHKPNMDTQQKDPLETLEAQLRSRAQALFSSVISTATELMQWQDPEYMAEDLRPDSMDDNYVCMLFNDEIHTYEQVISALTKAVNADQRKAVQFATTVDREGRSPVKDGRKEECESAKEIIIRQTTRTGSSKPLKTHVMHASVVAFQIWAMRALSWLQEVTSKTEGLRKLFCNLVMEAPQPGESERIVDTLMLADTMLWKAARVQTHELIMSGVLLDQECKKKFAVLFTKMYPRLMRAFMTDDHDHSVCVVSETVQFFTVPTLNYASVMRDFIVDDHERKVSIISSSVQLFTNPSVARMLITEHNLLEVIMNTFLVECESKVNDRGTFVFEKQNRHHAFRRAQYAFFDLKYALVCKPSAEEWTDALRTHFIAGFAAVLKLLKYMQNMDSVTRQVGQHIEFDPEWETAFNVQLKFQMCLTMLLDWCGMDKAVLLEAYKKTVEYLEEFEDPTVTQWEEIRIGNHCMPCIAYDVARLPVSVHVPLNRILAGLFSQTARFNMTPSDLLTSVQVVMGVEHMIEPSLRCLVLVAQTQANMWKRNGYSLLNQIYFYQNVRCRSEMYDRDVQMLQTGAALLDNNHFILHLLNKFGLNKWKQTNFDDISHDELTRYTITLAEEFLNLMLIIVGERYTEGIGEVTREDVVKHEIIHQLCMHAVSHSELTKALVEDPYHETGIEGVVSQVANFKKPSGSQSKGMYELKEELYKRFNPFFYHYSRQEQSAAMDAQKARQKQQAKDGEPQVLPPPLPPPFTAGYSNVSMLLNCDVMHFVMHLVLGRGVARRSKSWSETQYEKVLFLVGLALYEERRSLQQDDKAFNFVEKAQAKSAEFPVSLIEKLEEHLSGNRGQHLGQRELLSWVLKLFGEVLQQRNEAEGRSGKDMPMEVSVSMEVDEKTKREREKKAKQAAKRRAKIMAQMSNMQKAFIQENSELFEKTNSELQRVPSDMDISGIGASRQEVIAVGPDKSSADNCPQLIHTCILCQEEQEVTSTSRAMVLAAFVQKSTVLSQERGKYIMDAEKHDPTFTPASLIQGSHTNTCSHVMHADCWQGFYDNVILRERRRAQRFRHTLSYDLDSFEYLCPYCKALSNTVIPIVPYLHTLTTKSEEQQVELSFHDWLGGLQHTVSKSIQQQPSKEDQAEDTEQADDDSFLLVPCPLSAVVMAQKENVARNFQMLFEYIYEGSSANFSDGMKTMVKKFSSDAYCIGLGVEPDDENERVALLTWNTCAYSIITTEQLLRFEGKAILEEGVSKCGGCLGALVRHAALCANVLDKTVIRKHCVNLLSALVLASDERRLIETPCILDMDIFHYLVSLCLSLPTLYAEEESAASSQCRVPSGGLNDLHILRLALTAHLCQIMLTASFTVQEGMEMDSDYEAQILLSIYEDVRHKAGLRSEVVPSPHQLSEYVHAAVLPFLRCCALFFQLVTAVAEPLTLKDNTKGDEFGSLCHFLALSTNLSDLFSQDTVPTSMINNWCGDPQLKQKFMSSRERGEPASPLVTYPLRINQLVELPHDYSELINKVSTFTCPNSNGDESRAPTMCLVCGEMLCSQSYCCQTEMADNQPVGAATAHANTRGAGTGIFLRVRDCQILLLSGKFKGCFYSPPYLDDYGETDQGLRRGNPLRLCADRYKKLQKLWLSHSIPEQIARHLESNSALMSIEWNHL